MNTEGRTEARQPLNSRLMIRLGLSTWSLHRSLESGQIRLLDVPAELQAHAFTDLQICHFHLPSREPGVLDEMRSCIEEAEVTLDALLLDFGDISHPDHAVRDAAELEAWLPAAAQLGAKFVRISAGSQPPTEASLNRSAKHLLRLADAGEKLGVRVVTENWHALLPGSAEVLRLIELTQGRLPLCLDFGNWSGPAKYGELSKIAPHAVTVHAKCAFTAQAVPDAADFRRCLEVLRDAGYRGTIALIYDSPPPDEWRAIDVERALVREIFPGE